MEAPVKILVTGSKGFVGKNLVEELRNRGYASILECTRGTAPSDLDRYAGECAFVFHLAGVNRPREEREFFEGNRGFTKDLLALLERHGNPAPIAFTSSIQAVRDNPYGRSKKEAEDLLFAHGESTGSPVMVYRLPNVFGKWSRPDYNSAVATFCHNIARDLPISIHDPEAEISLCHIDDLVAEFLRALEGTPTTDGRFCSVPEVHRKTVGEVADLVRSFREGRKSLVLPNTGDPFARKLYSTYLSFLPEDGFGYPLVTHEDSRGSFTEIFRTPERGQVSVNVSKPGITKGDHWHHTKNEKFLVLSGRGIIRFRKVGGTEILEYPVGGESFLVVDIPPGYSHSISNTGETDLVTLMWASECFDPEHMDTHLLEVRKQ